MQGLKRARHTADSRLPITKSILTKIFQVLPSICRNDFESSLFAAAFSLAFHGLLRVGELVIHPNSSSRVLQSSDVNVDRAQGAINITITYSKTDQMGKGTVLNILRVGDQTCPFDNIVAFLRVRPNITGPFFCHFDSSPLTRYQFTAILSKAVKMLKLSSKYPSHSFRIGASTELALRGFSSVSYRNRVDGGPAATGHIFVFHSSNSHIHVFCTFVDRQVLWLVGSSLLKHKQKL